MATKSSKEETFQGGEMQNRLIEALIAKARRVKRTRDVREVAFGLADLSTKPQLHERMVGKGAVKSLLKLVGCQTHEAQRFAALALGNLSSSPGTKKTMADQDVMKPLIKFMTDEGNDSLACQYAALCIGNLMSDPENHEELVKQGGLAALVELLKSKDIGQGRYAAFALSNICTNSQFSQEVVDEGSIEPLVALACAEDRDAQRQALAALRGLAMNPDTRSLIVRAGVLDPLVLISCTEDEDLLEEVAGAFCTLSSIDSNKLEIADRSISTIVSLAMSDIPGVERMALCTLANLAEVVELHSHLIRENGLDPILALAYSDDPVTRGEGCRCLANLAANRAIQGLLVQNGAMDPLIEGIGSENSVAQRFGALGVANLASMPANQVKIVASGATEAIIKLIADPKKETGSRRYAALAVANLTATLGNHKALQAHNVCEALFQMTSVPDLMTQYYVAYALSNLASNVENHDTIVRGGGLQPIISLMTNRDPDVHQMAVAAIRGLAVTGKNQVKIVQEGGLDPLVHLAGTTDVEIQREVGAALCNLSNSDDNKNEIAESGVIPALLKLSESEDEEVSMHSCATLANLAELETIQKMIAEEQGIITMIDKMRSPFIGVQREAGRCFSNLMASISNHDVAFNSGGLSLLTSFLLSPDPACQRVGALGMQNLSTNVKFRDTMVDLGVFEPLASLARTEDTETEIKRYAVLTMANLAGSFESHEAMINDGVLSLLIALSNSSDEQVRQYAAFALVKISHNGENMQKVTEQGGLEPVLFLARTSDPEVWREVIPGICMLSFVDSNKVNIARSGGLVPIIETIKQEFDDASLVQLACCACANIAEVIDNHSRIVEAGGIRCLVKALREGNQEIRREAARGIGNLASCTDYSTRLVNIGAHKLLIDMLGKENPEVRAMAVMALANISTCVRVQQRLFEAEILEPLLRVCKSAIDPKTKGDCFTERCAMMCIANLAASPENNHHMVASVLDLLLAFCKSFDSKCRQAAICAIGNMASNPTNLNTLANEAFLTQIISFGFPGEPISQYQAIATIRGLSIHPEISTKLVEAGALDPLLMTAEHSSTEVQGEVAAALCNMSLSESNKLALSQSGGLKALMHLMHSDDQHRIHYALAAIANIAEIVDGHTHQRMISSGVIEPMLSHALSPYAGVRKEVSRAVALLSCNPNSHAELLTNRAVDWMAQWLQSNDKACEKYAALAAGNMALVVSNHKKLIEVRIIQSLVSCAKKADVETTRVIAYALRNFAAHQDNHAIMEKLGCIRCLIQFVASDDVDTYLQAIVALRCMALNRKSCRLIVESGILSAVAALCKGDAVEQSVGLCREICALLRNLSLNENNKVAILQQCLHPLEKFMHHSDPETAHQAVGIVANIAEDARNQGVLVDAGIIQRLKHVLRVDDTAIPREAVRAIANISAEYKFVDRIADGGAFSAIVPKLKSRDVLTQRFAALAVGNLATSPKNQLLMLSMGALQPLVRLAQIQNGDVETQRYATFAIVNSAAASKNHDVLLGEGVVNLLVNLVRSNDVDVMNAALLGLANFAAVTDNAKVLIEEGTLTVVIDMLRVTTNVETQLRSVCILRGLSVVDMSRTLIVESGGIDPLLRLTHTEDVELQREVLQTLCNLSLSGCVGKMHKNFLQTININALITFLCAADTTYRLFGAVTLGNVASATEEHEEIMDGGALTPLMNVMKKGDLETQRAIAYAVCNLAATVENRKAIVEKGGLAPISSLACSDDPDDAWCGITTLRGLSAHDYLRDQMVEAGVLEPLALGAQKSKVELWREVASTSFNLSLVERNKLKMSKHELCRVLLKLAKSDDIESVRMACGTFANLAENCRTHANISGAASKSFSFLNDLIRCSDGLARREACRFAANLAVSRDMHDVLVRDRVHESIIAIAENEADTAAATKESKDSDDVSLERAVHLQCLCFGTLALSNITAGRVSTHMDALIGAQITPVLVDLMASPDHRCRKYAVLATANLASETKHHKTLLDAGCLPRLVEALSSSNVGIQCKDWKNYDVDPRTDSRGRDLRTERCNLDASDSKVTSDQSHATKDEDNAVAIDDDECRFNAVFAIGVLVSSEDVRVLVGKSGAIDPIIVLTGSADIRMRCLAMHALRKLATHAGNRISMVFGGLLEKLPDIAQNDRVLSNQQELSALVCNLARSPENRMPIIESGIVPHLVHFINTVPNIEVVSQATAALANLAEDRLTHDAIIDAKAIHFAVHTMRSRHLSVFREGTRLVANLMTTVRAHDKLMEDGGFKALANVALVDDPICLYCSALAFRKTTPNVQCHDAIVAGGHLHAIIRLTKAEESRTKREALIALCDLSAEPKNKLLFLEEGGLNAVLGVIAAATFEEVSEDGDAHKIDADAAFNMNELLCFAIATVRHLSLSVNVKRKLYELQCLPFVLKYCCNPHEELRRHCAGVLANLADDPQNQVDMARHPKCLTTIGTLGLESDQLAVKRDVARAYALLTSSPENHFGIFDDSTVKVMCAFLKSGIDDDEVGLGMGIALGNLAVAHANHVRIAECGCLDPLVRLLSSASRDDCRFFAARAIFRLAACSENQIKLLDANALPPIIELLEKGREDGRLAACMAICNLATCEKARMAIAEANAIPHLVAMLDENVSTEGQRCGAMALCNLAADYVNQQRIVDAGGLEPLIRLVYSKSLDCKRYAGMTLCNLSTFKGNRPAMIAKNVLASLAHLTRCESVEVQRCASLELYNFSCELSSLMLIMESGAPETLIKLSGMDDLDCKRYSVMTLCNLASSSETRSSAIKAGGLQTLINVANERDLECRHYAVIALTNIAASEPNMQIQVLVHGGYASIRELIDDKSQSAMESRRIAAMAVCNLAANMGNHEYLLKVKCVEFLVEASTSIHSGLRLYATMALANMASNSKNGPILLSKRHGKRVLRSLISLAKGDNFNLLLLGVQALRQLATNLETGRHIVELGAVPVLARIAFGTRLAIVRQSLSACLNNLSLNHKDKVTIASGIGAEALNELCDGDDDFDTVHQGAGAIANLLEDTDTHEHLIRAGIAGTLLKLLGYGSVQIAREATRGLGNLLTRLENHGLFLAGSHVGSVVKLAMSDDHEQRYYAGLLLRKLSPNFSSHESIINSGGLASLAFLAGDRDAKVRQQSAMALRDIAANPRFKVQCAQGGVIETTKSLLRSDDEVEQTLALAIARHLSIEDSLKREIVTSGLAKLAIRCAERSAHKPDLQCQSAGLFANLAENMANQVTLVEQGITPSLVMLGRVKNDEVMQDASRAIVNLASNEENHMTIYRHGGLQCLIYLTNVATDDITKRYAAMGLRFLTSNPEVRCHVVKEDLLDPFLVLAHSDRLDYQRTAAHALSSFSMNGVNKKRLVKRGGLTNMLRSVTFDDLELQRDCMFAIANISDSPEYHEDMVKAGSIEIIASVGAKAKDARVQRSASRALCNLSINTELRMLLLDLGVLSTLHTMSRSLDVVTQRFAALAQTNLAVSAREAKNKMLSQGAVRPLSFLARFPDSQIQAAAATAIAALGLGDTDGCQKKLQIIKEGAVRPLADLAKYPDIEIQRCALLGLCALSLGVSPQCKQSVATADVLKTLLHILQEVRDIRCLRTTTYTVGALAETPSIKQTIGMNDALFKAMIKQGEQDDVEILRNVAYFLAIMAEGGYENHPFIVDEDGLATLVRLMAADDIEIQEYSTFAVAHLSSNHDYQVRIVSEGALKPLISMMQVHSQPRHYAGLALLKLADNYETHIEIAKEGGVHALLRLARAHSTDQELQYRAALTVGHLASNAIHLSSSFKRSSALGNATSSSSLDATSKVVRSPTAKTKSTKQSKGAARESARAFLDRKTRTME
eukprot:g2171.t1